MATQYHRVSDEHQLRECEPWQFVESNMEEFHYRAPQLIRVGTLKQIQGSNHYDDKDAGNDNYYI